MDDIDPGKVEAFVRLAKSRRGFPLEEKSPARKILHHLDLLEGDKITNAALLLFSRRPQRFFPTATVKCAVFHGLTKTKPIPSYKRPDLLATPHVTPQDTPHDTSHDTTHDTTHVTDTIKNLVLVLSDEMSREELQGELNIKDRKYFRRTYLNAAIDDGLIEMTIPDKPKSIYQKYRLTEKGKKAKEEWKK